VSDCSSGVDASPRPNPSITRAYLRKEERRREERAGGRRENERL
jgi:hypothetical protein